MSKFSTKVAAHCKKSSTLLGARQALVLEAIDFAKDEGNYDNVSVLLNGLWNAQCYSAAKIISQYIPDFSPIAITFDKDTKVFTSKKSRAKDAKPFITPDVSYMEWSRVSIEEELTAEKVISRIEGILKQAEENLDETGQDAVLDYLKSAVA